MYFTIVDIIFMYYGDGEDAYFMRKELEDISKVSGHGNGSVTARGIMGATQHRGRIYSWQWHGGSKHQTRGEEARKEWIHKQSTTRDWLSVKEWAWFDQSGGSSSAMAMVCTLWETLEAVAVEVCWGWSKMGTSCCGVRTPASFPVGGQDAFWEGIKNCLYGQWGPRSCSSHGIKKSVGGTRWKKPSKRKRRRGEVF